MTWKNSTQSTSATWRDPENSGPLFSSNPLLDGSILYGGTREANTYTEVTNPNNDWTVVTHPSNTWRAT